MINNAPHNYCICRCCGVGLREMVWFGILFLSFLSLSLSYSPSNCHLDPEGVWAIGILTGTTLFDLQTPHDHLDSSSLSLSRSSSSSTSLTSSSTSPSSLSSSLFENSTQNMSYCQRNPILSCIDVIDVPTAFVADPFLYVEDNDARNPWYAFFEVKNVEKSLVRRHGQIGSAVSYDQGITWEYLKIVVVADWHLSYPFIFKYNGEIYMMPQGNSISYWRATNFPLEWKYHSTVHNRVLNDATMIEYQGMWWMFALHEPRRRREHWFLHILYSNTPLGPWNDTDHNCFIDANDVVTCIGDKSLTPSPSSPPSSDRLTLTPHRRGHSGVRPGGHMIIDPLSGHLYRVVQNSRELYGDSMDLYRIDPSSLSPSTLLRDELIPEFRLNLRSEWNVETWNSVRYHHVDLHFLKFPSHSSHPGDGRGLMRWVALMDGDYSPGYGTKSVDCPRCKDLTKKL